MQYDLVFEGGGAKGSVFVGALQEFKDRGHTARRFVGTSAGAITATLMAAGYGPEEMLEAVNERLPNGKPRFSSFMDIPEQFEDKDIKDSLTYAIFENVNLPYIPEFVEKKIDKQLFDLLMKLDAYREMFSFVERGGLYEGKKFVEWLEEKLNADERNLGNSTLSDFNLRTQNDLSVVISDTTSHEMRVLNHRTAPDCPVIWAVRMSMSIPFVWQEVRWKKGWGKYLGEDISGHKIVDGGVLSNFPIDLLCSRDAEVVEVMGDTDPDAVPNLGMLIDEKLAVDGSGNIEDELGDDSVEGGLLNNVKRLKTVNRIKNLANTMMQAHDLCVIEAHENEVCHLPAKDYGTTEFDMSDVRLEALINAGRKAMKAFFDSEENAS